jgi:hypothetical protein
MTTNQPEGRDEAMKLALACFLEDLSHSALDKLSMEDQAAFAQDKAGLDVEGLISAYRYIYWHLEARAQALEHSMAGSPLRLVSNRKDA